MKKMTAIFLVVVFSLIGALPVFAANSSVVTVNPGTYAESGVVDGKGQYGKIILSSGGPAHLYIFYKDGSGVWKQMTIHDPGTGHILIDENGGTKSLDFYMNKNWQYKVEVIAFDYAATGNIRNYL